MDKTGVAHQVTRFIGMDIHRSYATVAAVDGDQQVVLTARRVDYEEFDDWIRKNLRLTDAVTLESTGIAWYFHDLLAPLVASIIVANPIQVAQPVQMLASHFAMRRVGAPQCAEAEWG